MLHTDWHFGKHFRTYVELKSGLESFRKGGPRPIDEKKLDFEEAFVELGTGEGDSWAALRVGPAGIELRFRASCFRSRRSQCAAEFRRRETQDQDRPMAN